MEQGRRVPTRWMQTSIVDGGQSGHRMSATLINRAWVPNESSLANFDPISEKPCCGVLFRRSHLTAVS
jgi:hypothetical protein